VTRSFFEFARPAPPRGHDGGSRLSTGARHLFRERLSGDTGAHGSSPDGSGGVPRREIVGSVGKRSALCSRARPPRVGRSTRLGLGSCEARTEPEEFAGQAIDRNKCTLQAWWSRPMRCRFVMKARSSRSAVRLPAGTDIVPTFAGELGRRALPRPSARWWKAAVGLRSGRG
jgi:hypothetical protein